MKQNRFKRAITAGEKQIGMWVSLAHNYSAEVVAHTGFDWLVIDMEHSPGDMMTTLSQLQAVATYGTALVRPSWNDTVMLKRIMDAGAPGVLVPMVQNREEAEAAVAACRYPPNGVRGLAGGVRGAGFGRDRDYVRQVDDETAIVLQIETQEALDNAVEIGTVPGVAGVFFGPADISADLGVIGQTGHEKVWAGIRKAAKALTEAGIPVGTLVLDAEFAAELLNEGFTFVAVGTDISTLAKGCDALLSTVKEKME